MYLFNGGGGSVDVGVDARYPNIRRFDVLRYDSTLQVHLHVSLMYFPQAPWNIA